MFLSSRRRRSQRRLARRGLVPVLILSSVALYRRFARRRAQGAYGLREAYTSGHSEW